MSQLYDLSIRFWEDMVSRPSGPLAFRFILQPVMASLLAVRDGYKDARDGRGPYLWTILHDPVHRNARLAEGFRAVARVILLGIGMEVIYQVTVLKAFRPVEMLNIVLLLAFVPYLIMRGPAQRIARRYLRKAHDTHSLPSG